ncbi:MAG: PaaI family thioesterase [Solirubrobacteraceae bacterium]
MTAVDHDPVETARNLAQLDGLTAMRAMIAGELPPPPIATLLGFDLVEVEKGRVIFAVEPGDQHYNPIGMVHGGLAATLIDSATGCAVHTTLPAGTGYTTTDVQVRFVRPITRDTGRIECVGEVVHVGRRLATAEARVMAGERLLAHGTASLLILPPDARTGSTGPPASASG